MSLRFDFESGTLKQDLAELPEKMLEGACEEIVQVVTIMKGLAQANVRVDTGSLRDSIRVERGGQGKNWREIRVRAGGYITNPKTGRMVDYAAIVEMKYPYMAPAWQAVCHDLIALIKRGVMQEVTL